jgi:hypothetical protein
LFFSSPYIKQLETHIKALEAELRKSRVEVDHEREQFRAREITLIDRLLAKNGVPEVDLSLKEPRDINNMAIFEDIEPLPRGSEDIVDERRGERLDAFAE